jgi:acetyl esterase/lipase
MQAVLDELKELKPRPLPSLSPEQARKEPGAKDASKRLDKERNGGKLTIEPVGKVEDTTVPTPSGNRTVRVYTPRLASGQQTGKPLPLLVFVHGGGWTIGSIAGYDSSARALANAAECVVVSVSYRYAPEHPFPAQHEDVYHAFQYIARNAARFGSDPRRVAIGGESAGGNISAGVCLMARDRKGILPIYQLLVYPPLDTRRNTPAYQTYANAVPLDDAQMRYFFRQVAPHPNQRNHPYLAPLQARSLKGVPPATILTAQIDPLADDGKLYAQRLQKAGIPVRFREFKGVTHEFFSMGAVLPDAKEAVAFGAEGLKSAFE